MQVVLENEFTFVFPGIPSCHFKSRCRWEHVSRE